jgi:hypothetical protein
MLVWYSKCLVVVVQRVCSHIRKQLLWASLLLQERNNFAELSNEGLAGLYHVHSNDAACMALRMHTLQSLSCHRMHRPAVAAAGARPHAASPTAKLLSSSRQSRRAVTFASKLLAAALAAIAAGRGRLLNLVLLVVLPPKARAFCGSTQRIVADLKSGCTIYR